MNRSPGLPLTTVAPPPSGLPEWEGLMRGVGDAMRRGQAVLAETTCLQALAIAQALLTAVGETLWVADEPMLDAVTAVSGSGPAYVFSFIEALEQGAVELGISPEDARRLAVATFVGASRLAAASEEPIGVLRERVTSKGGTTHAALTHLAEAGCNEAIISAIHKAARRSMELGDEFGKTG